MSPLNTRKKWIYPAIALPTSVAIAGPYAPAGGQSGSTAISASSSSIVEWASGATIVRGLRNVANPTEYSSDSNSPLNYAYYGGSDGASTNASNASVAAGGGAISSTANSAPIGMPPQPQSTFYAVSLGQNGSATLTFAQPITNGAGSDFAVFGNGFSSGPSLEWVKPALVQVSSDGLHFFTFPAVSLTQTSTQVGSFGEVDPSNLYDLAGKDPAGWGTPFDLSEMAAVSPLLNVNAVTEVRLLSISGSINAAYAGHDSQNHVINSAYPAASSAGSEGFGLAGVGVLNELTTSPANLTWTNAAGTGSWTDANWGGTSSTYQDGANVTFDNSVVSSSQTVQLNSTVAPASIEVNNSAGSCIIVGSGGITGSTAITKDGTQRLMLGTVNTYSGATIVNGGVLELSVNGALPSGNALTIGNGAEVLVDASIGPIALSSLNSAGLLDLTSNGLIVKNGNLATLISQVKAGANGLTWNGSSGIMSSSAAADSRHLTALGILQNQSAQGTALYTSTFDGAGGLNLSSSDVLVIYTYYGDANLDGVVDGSDYSAIDNGYLLSATGWQNGDFNYDGVIDGSDYTLIDNAFNRQGSALAGSQMNPQAVITDQIAVPEPTALLFLAAPLLARRLARRYRLRAFSLVELLVVIGIIAILIAILIPSLARARAQAQQVQCASNIRQLALANLLYAGDNKSFCVLAAADIFKDLGDGQGGYYRWHGTRTGPNQPFDPAHGPLAPYLGKDGRVKNCPSFDPSVGAATGNNFEQGCGGYGYNETYIGGRADLYSFSPPQPQQQRASAISAKIAQIRHSAETVMFTDTGIAQPFGSAVIVTEYSFCEPPWIQENPGSPSTDQAWPSIHFRHRGKANVAWADGHVTAEPLTFSNESYGLTSAQVQHAGVGWFGLKLNTLFQINK